MKRLTLILLACCLGVAVWAQTKEGARLSSEEFRAKQEAYITKRADLDQKEIKKFFPLFFELQDKKKELNDKMWKLIKSGRDESTTEAEYDNIVKEAQELKLQSDKLEQEYYRRFRKILSAKKVYKVQVAEMTFHRELLKGVNKRHEDDKNKKKDKK